MADKTLDIQLIKSTVWRATMDELYFNTAPQLAVIEGQANMEDALTRRPGGIIRMSAAGAVTPIPTSSNNQNAMAMMSYLDSVRESRVGMRRWSPGLEGSELNPLATTATGVNAVEDASDDTLELIARNFGELGVKPLFKRMLELICKHQQKALTVRLRGKWVDIDPSTWDTDMDMEVMVGLGTGSKDRQVGQMMSLMTQITAPILQMQGGLSGPLVTGENLKSQTDQLVESMGFKITSNFFSDPATAPPQQPKPDPKVAQEQAKQATIQAANTGKMQVQQQNHALSVQADAAKSQTRVKADLTIKAITARLDQEKSERDAQLKEWMAQQENIRRDQAHQMDGIKTVMSAIHDHQKHVQAMELATTKAQPVGEQ